MKKKLSIGLLMMLLLFSTSSVFAYSGIKTYSGDAGTKWFTLATAKNGFNCNMRINCTSHAYRPLHMDTIGADVRMLDKKGNVVWSENESTPGIGSRTYWCGSNVYTLQVKFRFGGGFVSAEWMGK